MPARKQRMNFDYKIYSWLVPVLVTIIFFAFNYQIPYYTIQGDEGGYLSYAAAYAGFVIDNPTSYHSGYPFFISPAFWFGKSPEMVFLYIKLINSLMWGITTYLLIKIVELFYPDESKRNILLSTILGMFYPAWAVLAGYVFSENAYVMIYTFSVYSLFMIIKDKRIYWIIYSVCLALLFAVHAKSIPVLLSGLIASSMLVFQTKQYRWWAVFLAMLVMLIALYKFILTPYLIQIMLSGDFPYKNHYPSMTYFLGKFTNIDMLLKWLHVFAGQSTYLIFTTFGFIVLPLIDWINIKKPYKLILWQGNRNDIIKIYLLLSVIGTLLLSSIIMGEESTRIDHAMYGRYNEGVLLPMLAISFLMYSYMRLAKVYVVTVFLCVVFFLTFEDYSGLVPLNITGIWQYHYIDYKDDSWYLYCFSISMVFLLVFILISKKFIIRSIFIAAISLIASLTYIKLVHIEHVLTHGNRQENAYYIRKHFDPGTCVAFDRRSSKGSWQPTFYFQYILFLYDYDYKRLSPDEWYEKCDGPLLSWNQQAGAKFDNIYPIMKELRGGPFLYVKKDSPPLAEIDSSIEFNNVIQSRAILKEGWYDTEKWGVWSGFEARVKFSVPKECKKNKCTAKFTYMVFNAGENEPKKLYIKVNQEIMYDKTVTSGVQQEIAIPIKLETIAKDSEVEVSFNIPNAVSPSLINLSEDDRILGLGLIKMRLERE